MPSLKRHYTVFVPSLRLALGRLMGVALAQHPSAGRRGIRARGSEKVGARDFTRKDKRERIRAKRALSAPASKSEPPPDLDD